MIKKVLVGALALVFSVCALSQDNASTEIADKFKSMYPNTKFREIKKSAVNGLYEVVMGDNIAYTDESGRYFIFGHMFDMREQVDMTAARKSEMKKVEFPKEHLGNAIKTVKGDGSRVLAVFSDPDCPYCKKLERELAKINNVTIYTFLYPLESLHPDAKRKSIAVWCSKDRVKAWAGLMLNGVEPLASNCANPIDSNVELGSRFGIVGTPTIISLDGRTMPGAAPVEKIDQWLGGK